MILLHKRNIPLRGERRNSMFVYHLLTTFAVDDNREIIERFNNAPNLEAIH